LPERGAERLEDRAQDVLGILPFEQPDVDVEPGAGGELVQEPGDDVARETARELAREVDVRGDERAVRDLDDDARERLVAGQERRAAAGCTRGAKQFESALPSALARGGDLLLGASGETSSVTFSLPQRASSPTRWSSAGRPVATARSLPPPARRAPIRVRTPPERTPPSRGPAQLGDALDRGAERAAGARRSARSRGRSRLRCRSWRCLGAEARDHERYPGADVRARHALADSRAGRSRPRGAGRTEIRAHRDELVDEDEPVLEHLLVDQGCRPRACVATATAIEVRSAGNVGHGPSSIFGV
jgi:hypothetical protein